MRLAEDFCMIVVLGIGVLVVMAAFLAGSAGSNPRDVTSSYTLPEELKGCKVYRLDASGFERTLYVVARKGQPIVTGWDDGGKNALKVEVATP